MTSVILGIMPGCELVPFIVYVLPAAVTPYASIREGTPLKKEAMNGEIVVSKSSFCDTLSLRTELNWYCLAAPVPGLRMITFPPSSTDMQDMLLPVAISVVVKGRTRKITLRGSLTTFPLVPILLGAVEENLMQKVIINKIMKYNKVVLPWGIWDHLFG